MSLSFLVAAALKSLVCAALTLLLLRLFRGRSAAERSRLGHAGLLATLLLPFAALALPPVHVEPPPAVAPIVAAVAGPAPTISEVARVPGGPTEIAAPLPRWDLVAAVPAALLLLLTLFAVLRLQRLRRRSHMLVDPQWLTALASTQERFGFRHGTALLVSDELSSPISWGVLRPVILLDRAAAADPRQAEAIVAHELAHVARLDWAKLLIGRVACALFWFNPLVWILAARCHELREEAADDAVLRTDYEGADYAELLVGIARHENRGLLLAANGVAPSRGSLARRVRRVLDPSCRRDRAGLAWTLACCLAVAGGTLSLAVVTLAAPAAVAAPRAEGLDSPVLAEALIVAARRGDMAEMRKLIDLGVSPDAVLPGDGTPLIAAARAGRADSVGFLLAAGADIALAVPDDGSPLIAAAASGHVGIVTLLLNRGAPIEQVSPTDDNPLIRASHRGHEPVVRLLLARGADPNSRAFGRTPLLMARRNGHPGVEALLLEAGARE